MADKDEGKEKDKDAAAPEADKPKEGGADDLMDIFADDEVESDEELAILVNSLEDVPIDQLLAQVRDIRDVMNQRRAA
ncbi:MAG: hypothetical protein V3S98_05200 [Dehalococcoidia bacterium]